IKGFRRIATRFDKNSRNVFRCVDPRWDFALVKTIKTRPSYTRTCFYGFWTHAGMSSGSVRRQAFSST
ncbi:TPA: hypothetical protein ACRQ5E_003107, partial [Legionella pneumophila]